MKKLEKLIDIYHQKLFKNDFERFLLVFHSYFNYYAALFKTIIVLQTKMQNEIT